MDQSTWLKRPEKMTNEMEREYFEAAQRGDIARCKEIIEACGLRWITSEELDEQYKKHISAASHQ